MIDLVSKLTPSILAGILIGSIMIWWVEPTNGGGMAVLLLLSIIVSIVVGMFLRYLKNGRT